LYFDPLNFFALYFGTLYFCALADRGWDFASTAALDPNNRASARATERVLINLMVCLWGDQPQAAFG
jgi:hypothetical protein